MNYLELVQTTLLLLRAGNERLDDPPTTVTGLTGIQYEVAQWVRLSEQAIQNHRSGWLFMERNITIDIPGAQRVINLSAAVTDYFAMTAKMGDNDPPFITVYRSSGDGSDTTAESKVFFVKWADWTGSIYDRLPRAAGDLPNRFTIQPDGQLVFDPAPSDVIRCNFNYRAKSVPMPADVASLPVVPEPYHMLIVYWAILKFYCLTRDKTQEFREKTKVEFNRELTKLYNEQLPSTDAGGTILA